MYEHTSNVVKTSQFTFQLASQYLCHNHRDIHAVVDNAVHVYFMVE